MFQQKKDVSAKNENLKRIVQSQPRLEPGISLVEKPEGLPGFQALLSTELAANREKAVWIDSKNEASTYALKASGNEDIMRRTKIGRAFTPFQHNELVARIEEILSEDVEVLILPKIEVLYEDGQVKEWEAQELFQHAWNTVKEATERYELKTLVSTVKGPHKLYRRVEAECSTRIQIEATQHGWKYDKDDFEQMAYQDQGHMQTTVPLWKQKTSREKEKAVAEVS